MIRIGSVPYLNARPLVAGLARNPAVRFIEEIPSALARTLGRGELDVALVSSIEAIRHGLERIVDGIGVISDGPVLSVKLVGRTPPAAARSVGLDGASLTASTLTRVIYHEFLGRTDLEFRTVEPAPDPATTGCDATLMIGDAALDFEASPDRRSGDWYELDLGEIWSRETGLPFVWAVWLLAPDADRSRVSPVLEQARDRGLARLESDARSAATELDLPPELAHRYLTRVIGYRVGPREWEGLARFGELSRRWT